MSEWQNYEWTVELESHGEPVGTVVVEAHHYIRAGSLAKDAALTLHSVGGVGLEVVKLERGRAVSRS